MSLPIVERAERPGILDLGWGHPDPALLPLAALRRAAVAALDRFGTDALEYGHPAGAGPLLEWLIGHISRAEGRAPASDEILITPGLSGGLDQVIAAVTRPGDVILVESPTYHLALRVLQDRGLDLIPVPADDDGLLVDALADRLSALRRAGRSPRALYLVPTFNNPTGASLAPARRAALVALAAAEELLILEDDVYRELAYDAPAPPSLWSLAPPGVVARLGSFSKSLAPGLRLGWLTAGRDLVARLVGGGLLDSGGGHNHYAALVVAALCASGAFETHVERLRAEYRARRDALAAALPTALPPGASFRLPGGGYFIWLTLPPFPLGDPRGDPLALRALAETAGVSFVPGARFHSDGAGQSRLRLAFSFYAPNQLAEAARRLGRALAPA
jgi:DNA-binding transcriptional MocR family regulator